MHQKPTALVTGGSRGIGRGICLALAEHGFSVAVNYRGNREAAEETRSALLSNADSFLCQGDVGVDQDRRRMIDEILNRWQRIDLLVNNAGITSVGRHDILEASEESWDQVCATNLKGPFFLTQRVAQEMIRLQTSDAKPADYGPSIVNVSSLSAYTVSINRGDYCISKAGLAMATQLFAARLAEYDIPVFEVRPGIIDTDMTAGGREKYTKLIAEGLTPIRRWGTPQDVGKAVAGLATGVLPFSTGEVINVDGGFHLRRL